MKKLILIFFIFTNILFAKDINSKLFEYIFKGLFPSKENILIYDIGNNKYNLDKISYTNEIYNSNLIFINEFYMLDIYSNKPIFVSSKKQLKRYENAVGALYWENDEAKVVFIKERLNKFNIKVSNHLEKYLVNEKIYSF